jgi:hypothetical protein
MSPAARARAWRSGSEARQSGLHSRTGNAHALKPSNLRRSVVFSPEEEQQPRDIDGGEAIEAPPETREAAYETPAEHEGHGLLREEIRSMTSKFRQDAAEANKENAHPGSSAGNGPDRGMRFFNERQDNAERVQFDTQPSRGDPSYLVTEEDAEWQEPSQDEGFEQDRRRPSNRGKRPAPDTDDSPRGKRPRRTPAQNEPQPSLPNMRSSKPRNRSQPPSPNSSPIEPRNQPPTSSATARRTAHSYTEVNHNARARMVFHAADRQPQTRIPWSKEETSYLHEKIEELGISWAKIKAHDEENEKRLWRRDQVALKDKARNMLLDYLKYALPLIYKPHG